MIQTGIVIGAIPGLIIGWYAGRATLGVQAAIRVFKRFFR